jgi:uncharacterized YccA/Bax inhibitor family protein
VALRLNNPAFGSRVLDNLETTAAQPMTVAGTVNKTAMLLALVLIGAAWTWTLAAQQAPSVLAWMFGGLVGGAILALIQGFNPRTARFLSQPYALCEGLVLGGLSALVAAQFPTVAIVPEAVGLTMGVLLVMLLLYRTGVIRATNKFVIGITAATAAVALVYLVSMVMNLFGYQMPYLHSNGPIGIGISLVIVAIAALNLVLDFAWIEAGVQQGAPRYLEWYGAFGLLVTLVWLYLEILRLLSKLNRK